MEKGIRIKFKEREGVSLGPIYKFGIWWILVEYEDETRAVVLEKELEVICESR
tara:strand:- start:564 stop:722 length:159 start_codon:yes stop_codon:yes gene_type:complete